MEKFRRNILISPKKTAQSYLLIAEQLVLPFPAFVYNLFYIFGGLVVLPFIDIPFLGLSITAPIFFFIAAVCIFKPREKWFRSYRLWILLAVLFWVGVFFSTAFNGLLSSGVDIESGGIATVIMYIYWLIVFVITAVLASQEIVLKKLSTILGWSTVVLALLRWSETIILRHVGVWTLLTFLSQNAYGFLFSCFSPYPLFLIFQERGRKRFFAIIGTLLVWGALAINASRGSWVAVLSGLGLTLVLLLFSNPRKFSGLFFIVLIMTGMGSALWRMLPDLTSTIETRFATFQNLEEDKSALLRQVMIQKGIRLFKGSPIIGVGASRFTRSMVELDIPRALSYSKLTTIDRKNPHNTYIGILAEYGLVGAVPFALILIILFSRGGLSVISALRHKDLVPLPMYLSLFQMSVHLIVISSTTNTADWFVYGLAASIIEYSRIKQYK